MDVVILVKLLKVDFPKAAAELWFQITFKESKNLEIKEEPNGGPHVEGIGRSVGGGGSPAFPVIPQEPDSSASLVR